MTLCSMNMTLPAYPLNSHRHLDSVHGLAIVNKAAVNTSVKYFFEILFLILLGIYPEVELLDQMVTL